VLLESPRERKQTPRPLQCLRPRNPIWFRGSKAEARQRLADAAIARATSGGEAVEARQRLADAATACTLLLVARGQRQGSGWWTLLPRALLLVARGQRQGSDRNLRILGARAVSHGGLGKCRSTGDNIVRGRRGR
jgi:hypothetical protein